MASSGQEPQMGDILKLHPVSHTTAIVPLDTHGGEKFADSDLGLEPSCINL